MLIYTEMYINIHVLQYKIKFYTDLWSWIFICLLPTIKDWKREGFWFQDHIYYTNFIVRYTTINFIQIFKKLRKELSSPRIDGRETYVWLEWQSEDYLSYVILIDAIHITEPSRGVD